MKYFVDYGHGGSDSGAVSNGIYEKNVNRLIGERVKYHLERHNQKVVLTRTTDEYRSLDERVAIIEQNKCDLGISIHCNSFSDDTVRGVETYTWGNGSKEKLLATKVHSEILKAKLYKKNRGLKEEKFRILSPSIPCCLVEVGFISNVADRLLILENIEEFAIAITKGLLGYYDMQYYQDKQNNTIPLNQVLFKVQVGAYKDENNAKKMVERLRELGFNSIIVQSS